MTIARICCVFTNGRTQLSAEIEGKKTPVYFAKATATAAIGAGLDHQKQRPAIEEAPQRPERFAQIDVLPSRVGHRRGEFAIAQRRNDRKHGGDDPGHQQQARAIAPAARCRRPR